MFDDIDPGKEIYFELQFSNRVPISQGLKEKILSFRDARIVLKENGVPRKLMSIEDPLTQVLTSLPPTLYVRIPSGKFDDIDKRLKMVYSFKNHLGEIWDTQWVGQEKYDEASDTHNSNGLNLGEPVNELEFLINLYNFRCTDFS